MLCAFYYNKKMGRKDINDSRVQSQVLGVRKGLEEFSGNNFAEISCLVLACVCRLSRERLPNESR